MRSPLLVAPWIILAAVPGTPLAVGARSSGRFLQNHQADVSKAKVRPGQAEWEALRGQPAVVEIPLSADLGRPLGPLPRGWGYLQATADTVSYLEERLGVKSIPSVVYVDRYGNALHRDQSSHYRRRLNAGLHEFTQKRKELRQRLARIWASAEEARARSREAQELHTLFLILARRVVGYEEVRAASRRLDEVARDREDRLLKIMAGEGLLTNARLETKLRELEKVSRGLTVADRIRRERERMKKLVEVERKLPRDR